LAWQLNRVVDYIEMHLADKITVTILAGLTNVSTGQLFRAFKTSVGVTPWHYITKRRIELACTMMKTTQAALAEIAVACGLCDQPHLCKLFRRIVGMSPSAWRRMMPAPDAKPIRAYPLRMTHSGRMGADSGLLCVSSCQVSTARVPNSCMKKLLVRTSSAGSCDLGSTCLL
jgi:AraC-like DNA-binding protein